MKPNLEQLADYALGFLPPEEARLLDVQLARDPALARRLNQMQTGFVTRLKETAQALQVASREQERRRLPWLKKLRPTRRARAFLLLAGLLLSAGLVVAAVCYKPALLHDDFDDGAFSAKNWQNAPEHIKEGGLVEEKGFMRLVNRGYLVTREEFPGPIEVSFDWKWIRLNGLKPQYADTLCVALRTTGTASSNWTYEATDGIVVRFDSCANQVIIRTHPSQEFSRESPPDSVIIPPDVWHKIRIRDDGETVSVYFSGPAMPESDQPVLRVRCPYEGKAHHVAVYNREAVAFPHESYIDNFVIRGLR